MRFRDKVVFITGAARGQGRAHALAFAQEGANLVLCDTLKTYSSVPYTLSEPDELMTVARSIEEMERSVLAMHVDVLDEPAMQRLIQRAEEQIGPIDIIVANAGLYSFGLTWKLTEQQWDDTVNVILKGEWLTCKSVIPSMITRRKGKIICTGSISSFRGLYGLGHFVAANYGIVGLVKTLAIELAPYNINVNAICPTTLDTDMVNNQAFYDYFAGNINANAHQEFVIAHMNELNLLPDRGMLAPEDISKVVLWLASDDARHLTGCALPIDAGLLTK